MPELSSFAALYVQQISITAVLQGFSAKNKRCNGVVLAGRLHLTHINFGDLIASKSTIHYFVYTTYMVLKFNLHCRTIRTKGFYIIYTYDYKQADVVKFYDLNVLPKSHSSATWCIMVFTSRVYLLLSIRSGILDITI